MAHSQYTMWIKAALGKIERFQQSNGCLDVLKRHYPEIICDLVTMSLNNHNVHLDRLNHLLIKFLLTSFKLVSQEIMLQLKKMF